MTSTKKTAATCVYLELDITDRYADSRRAMDVCGLEIRDHTLTPHFWTWSWGPTDLIDLTDLIGLSEEPSRPPVAAGASGPLALR